MTSKSNTNDLRDPVTTGKFGPYLQNIPRNPLNGLTSVGNTANRNCGWVYDAATGKIEMVNTNGSGVVPY